MFDPRLYHNRTFQLVHQNPDPPATVPSIVMPPIARLLAEETVVLANALPAHDRILWISAFSGRDSDRRDCLHLHCEDPTSLNGSLRAPIDAWPFRDRCFDQVVLQHTLDYSPLIAVVVAEALRVLKPERELWITGFGPFGWQRIRLALAGDGGRRLRPPRLGHLRALLASHGCVDLDASRLGTQPGPARAHEFTGRYLLCARKREIRPIHGARRVRALKPKAGAWSPTTREAA